VRFSRPLDEQANEYSAEAEAQGQAHRSQGHSHRHLAFRHLEAKPGLKDNTIL